MQHRIAALFAATVFALPATAQDDTAFVSFEVLKPEVALPAAQAALDTCRANGYQVGVTVIDRFGIPQVFLRDRFAGPHVYDVSRAKAWTAVTFRAETSVVDASTQPGSVSAGIRDIDGAIAIGGGVPIRNGEGSIVGGIGVSGADGPDKDEDCANAGIAAIEDQIAF